jgi:YVTN family beta-propeller protein
MNATISSLDHLADDDIAGARALYPRPAVNAVLGSSFRYQVVAPNNPTSYSATGLPPGLDIDAVSGLISGVPNLSGSYSVVVSANSPSGGASIPLQIVVTTPGSTTLGMLQKLDISVNRLVADPKRARVYATVPASNSVAVIDTVSLAIIKTLPIGSNPVGLAISADGTRLWVANSGSNVAGIGVIDLNSLTTLPSVTLPNAPSDVEEGLDNRLYATPASSQNDGLMQVNTVTGETRTFGSFEVRYAGFLEISPDRKTLYVGDHNVGPATACRFDVSTAVPTLLQQVRFNGGSGLDLKLSHDGRMLVFPSGGGNGQGYSTYEIPAANLTGVLGSFTPGSYPGPAAFSGDDSFLYHSSQAQSKIAIFDARTFALTGAINLGTVPGTSNGSYDARDLALDNTGSKLFIATSFYFQNGDLRIYETGRTNAAPVAAKSLANVSTRLSVQPGDDALIGGFIIQGSDSKTVVVRAIGPSLPVTGKLLDPKLQIYDSAGGVIASNDNWNSDRTHVLNTGLAPKDEHEAVVIVSLAPGAYTAVVRGVGNTAGVGLVELYDIDSNHSRMANISTRGKVEAGDNVMIGGFIVAPDQSTKVMIRGIGPSLREYGVAAALEDPILELHDGNGSLITENDDWRSLQEQAINDTGIPPIDDREAAIVATLQPGAYTAIVRGKNDGIGVGLVEMYNLDAK